MMSGASCQCLSNLDHDLHPTRVSLPQQPIQCPPTIARIMQGNYDRLRREIRLTDQGFENFKSNIRDAARMTLVPKTLYDDQESTRQENLFPLMNGEALQTTPFLLRFVDAWPAKAYIAKYLTRKIADLNRRCRLKTHANMEPGHKSASLGINGVQKNSRFRGLQYQKLSSNSQAASAGDICPTKEKKSVAAFLRSVDPLLERLTGTFTDVGLGTLGELDKFARKAAFDRTAFFVQHLMPVPTKAQLSYINDALDKRMIENRTQE
ncbi:hypothetical protein BJ138DRAFT_1189217 [Hygrophoropsis aurantiaca]|uniref:Uncharacterized protein n=1 Tax=Hygrophoropsis aurantiaca TaxID=72124 RepID=A0ACB8AC76_9AGAM|nr:hypothetical protein BJ138DRAFT_1189217 [Hygrophoropsis aurantiaca]